MVVSSKQPPGMSDAGRPIGMFDSGLGGLTVARAVIDLLPGHTADEAKGATMRLGASEVRLAPGTRARGLYRQDVIFERHRHRW